MKTDEIKIDSKIDIKNNKLQNINKINESELETLKNKIVLLQNKIEKYKQKSIEKNIEKNVKKSYKKDKQYSNECCNFGFNRKNYYTKIQNNTY